MGRYRSSTRFSVGKLLSYLAASLWAITTLYPFVWVLLNSFKERRFIRTNSFSLPFGEAFTLDNYKVTFERFDIFPAYRNSIIISVLVMAAVVVLAGLAAYALARYRFPGKGILQGLILASMMFPVFSTIIPVFRMMHRWGIVNTDSVGLSLLSVILPQIAGNLAFAIIVLWGFIRSLPIDLEEAAYLEGCRVFGIFFRVILPIARPSFATVAIFSFLWSYNDLFTQLFFLRRKEAYSITLLLNEVNSQAGVNYGLLAAAVVLVVVPVVIVYILLQKNIIKGMTAGAVKG